MTKNLRSLLRRIVCAALCLLPLALNADALLKTLPMPDTSKLAPEVAKKLAAARADFDKTRVDLIGNDLATAYAVIGAQYARTGFNDVAAIAFYDASQLRPKDSRWLYLRGVLARTQKLDADARADFEAALALDQGYLPIRYRLAETLVDQHDLDGARKLLQAALPQHEDQASLFAMLGRVELKQQRYAEAVEHLNRALQIEPQATALYADLAAAYTAQGNAAQASQMQAKAGPGQPSLVDPLVVNMYNPVAGSGKPIAAANAAPLEQARALVALSQFQPARAKLDEALKNKPDDIDALVLAARIDALTGKRAMAQDEAARALRLRPDNAAAMLAQGMVYEFAGDDANAYIYYQRAVRADPKLADAQVLLGNAEMRRGHYGDAAAHYRDLAAITQESVETTSRLSAALVAAGRCGDALAHVNELLGKRAQDGDLMQVFVRLASTCAAANPQERSMALDYGQALYKERPNASDSAALALAFAASGKFDEAQKYQAEAIYEAERGRDKTLADMYRGTMRQFAAKQAPDRPWPAEHDYFKAPLLTSLPAPAGSAKSD